MGLVAQSVMSATGMLGHRDVCVLSATDPHPRQWVCVCTMPNDVGTGVGNCPHMSVHGDNTTPISNDSVA